MAVLPILLWPDARLSQPCPDVTTFDEGLRRLSRDMLETMYAASGRGLAGPQVGAMQRLFVMDVTWKAGTADPLVLVNPAIVHLSEARAIGTEGCLSIPGLSVPVSRATSLRLRWTTLDGVPAEAAMEGFAAICAQHECDHLDGLVTLDRIAASMRDELLTGYRP